MLFSISMAVVLVVALAATGLAAAAGSVSVSGPSSISTGQQVQITVSGTGDGVNGTVAVSNLTIDSISNQFSSASGVVLLPSFGTASVVYTCTVTAGAGETASFSVTGATAAGPDNTVVDIPGASWSATVAAENPSTPTPDQPDQPDQPATPTEGNNGGSSNQGGSSNSGSQSGTSSSNGSTDKMPKTGDATMDLWTLAVIAAGCVGIAVFAGKKAFSAR